MDLKAQVALKDIEQVTEFVLDVAGCREFLRVALAMNKKQESSAATAWAFVHSAVNRLDYALEKIEKPRRGKERNQR